MRLLMLETCAEVVSLPERLMTPREHGEEGTIVLQSSPSWVLIQVAGRNVAASAH